jgi:hypothetical protein
LHKYHGILIKQNNDYKKPDKVVSEDKFGKAGHEAETQMTFYLHGAFTDAR